MVGGLYCLFRLGDAGDRVTHCLIGSGLLLGFACAAKAVTLAMAPVLLIAFLAQARRWISRDAIVPLLIGGGGFSLLGSVPYVRAWLISGNPVFPFYNGIFKSEYFPPENFSQPHFMRGFSWDTIYQITFDSGKYLEASAGASGFQWLLLLCGGIAALLLTHRWRGAWIALIGILMVAAVFQHQSYLQYIFPATILLAVLIGGAYATVFSSTAAMRWPSYALFGVALLLNLAFLNAGAYFRDMPLASIVSDDARRDYRTDFVR